MSESIKGRQFQFQQLSGPLAPGETKEFEGIQINFAHPPPFAIVTKDGRVFIPEQNGDQRTMIDLAKKVRELENEWAMKQALKNPPPIPPIDV